MRRLTRAEMQERTRAKVLAAARDEFAERGFREAKIDGIADRAGLTRGAVYSNFPGKRALYFTVLADEAERSAPPALAEAERTAAEALAALARAWVARLPLAVEAPRGVAGLGVDLMPEILAEQRTRQVFAQLMKLNAIVLGLSLERLRPRGAPAARLVRVAESVLTALYGVSQMSAAAPGFVDPFDAVTVCERLADLPLGGGWPPVAGVPQVQAMDRPWSPADTAGAANALDALRAEPERFSGDGVVAVLGLRRLEAAEEAVRAAPDGTEITAVLVTDDPDELAPLARLILAELAGCLRQAFPPSSWPPLRVVFDPSGDLAAAAGVSAVSDETETAVRIEADRIVARADGRLACHAIASMPQATIASVPQAAGATTAPAAGASTARSG
ncbi:DNA-binding transcriptional regulator, AcrR family [Sinosporangium album]|uniref:DNA-binding transcriptional regulator, AcrR family n=1 Tax=Sinosporangium album TaxID=504805 RepID=A0A1G8IHL4_9ACTN|nr:TetR/AcrR family transcriptional regulator [Sinosporangium album]SDI18020.1 DNA-binding transcriptional regulator, AcrR family [Sinosporangium album]